MRKDHCPGSMFDWLDCVFANMLFSGGNLIVSPFFMYIDRPAGDPGDSRGGSVVQSAGIDKEVNDDYCYSAIHVSRSPG